MPKAKVKGKNLSRKALSDDDDIIYLEKRPTPRQRGDEPEDYTANRLAPPSPRYEALACLGLPSGLGRPRQPKSPT